MGLAGIIVSLILLMYLAYRGISVLVLAPRLMVLYGYREVGGDLTTLNIGQIVRRSEIFLAGSRNLPAAEIERWKNAFAAVQADGTVDRIVTRYTTTRPEAIPIEQRRRGDEIRW